MVGVISYGSGFSDAFFGINPERNATVFLFLVGFETAMYLLIGRLSLIK